MKVLVILALVSVAVGKPTRTKRNFGQYDSGLVQSSNSLQSTNFESTSLQSTNLQSTSLHSHQYQPQSYVQSLLSQPAVYNVQPVATQWQSPQIVRQASVYNVPRTYSYVQEPLYTQHVQPLYRQQAQPLYTQQVQPLYTQNVQPYYTQSAQPFYNEQVGPVYRQRTEPLQTYTLPLSNWQAPDPWC